MFPVVNHLNVNSINECCQKIAHKSVLLGRNFQTFFNNTVVSKVIAVWNTCRQELRNALDKLKATFNRVGAEPRQLDVVIVTTIDLRDYNGWERKRATDLAQLLQNNGIKADVIDYVGYKPESRVVAVSMLFRSSRGGYVEEYGTLEYFYNNNSYAKNSALVINLDHGYEEKYSREDPELKSETFFDLSHEIGEFAPTLRNRFCKEVPQINRFDGVKRPSYGRVFAYHSLIENSESPTPTQLEFIKLIKESRT